MQLSRIKKPNLNRCKIKLLNGFLIASIPDRGQGISKIVTKRQINLGHHPALDPDNLTMITLDPIVNIFSMINGKDLLADKKNQIRHNS
jgi:hypothetical protein